VFVVPNPGLLFIERKSPQYFPPSPSASELGLKVDIENDTPDSDPVHTGSSIERQQMECHRFKIDGVRS